MAVFPTYALTVNVSAPTDQGGLEGVRVVALLDRVEVDQTGIIVQADVVVTTDANGVATLELWPNTRGSGQSQYVIFAIDADDVPLFEYRISMSAYDVGLADLVSGQVGTPLTITANALSTIDTTPTLSGTVSDPSATIEVEVASSVLAVTLDDLSTTDTTPTLAGTVSDPAATISIEVA